MLDDFVRGLTGGSWRPRCVGDGGWFLGLPFGRAVATNYRAELDGDIIAVML